MLYDFSLLHFPFPRTVDKVPTAKAVYVLYIHINRMLMNLFIFSHGSNRALGHLVPHKAAYSPTLKAYPTAFKLCLPLPLHCYTVCAQNSQSSSATWAQESTFLQNTICRHSCNVQPKLTQSSSPNLMCTEQGGGEKRVKVHLHCQGPKYQPRLEDSDYLASELSKSSYLPLKCLASVTRPTMSLLSIPGE